MTAPTATLSDKLEELGKAATLGEPDGWLHSCTVSDDSFATTREGDMDPTTWVKTPLYSIPTIISALRSAGL